MISRVLLVEDNLADRELIVDILASDDILVDEAESVQEAKLMIGQAVDGWHLILLDLNLADGSGLEVLRSLRSGDRHRWTPVVVVTSSDAESDIRQCCESQANAVIQKPLEFARFQEVFESLRDFWLNHVQRVSGESR